jgi:hypothetical protein
VRRYGGLKDQDRIFTNAYLKHDFGLKGALVSPSTLSLSLLRELALTTCPLVPRRLAQNKRNPLERRFMDYPDCEGLWPAWAWWCRVPQRSQMELYEQAWLGKRPSVSSLHVESFRIFILTTQKRKTAIPRRQRRRR